jgi:hypothetical protein
VNVAALGLTRTTREQIPRIFPGFELRVPAAFCGELPNGSNAKKQKVLIYRGLQWWAL